MVCLSASAVLAQGMYDALRYSTQYYDGTARGVGMGNAMLSLGGDIGALSYNPAASGVYRYSEVSLTPGFYINNSSTTYLGTSHHSDYTSFNLSNAGYIGSFETQYSKGLLNFNLGIATNQTNNFAFRTSATGIEAASSYLASLAANVPKGTLGYDMTIPDDDHGWPFRHANASWEQVLAWNCGLIDTIQGLGPDSFIGATENINSNGFYIPGSLHQSYFNERSGYIQDIILNASGNVDNIFFFGANLTVQSIWFSEYSKFSEEAVDHNNFLIESGGSGFRYVTSEYTQKTQGTGVKLQAGFIVRPIAGLSIGGSISTPTWMFLSESWIHTMKGHTDLYGGARVESPVGIYEYRVTAPFKWSLGASYTLNDFMAVGVDYERVDYSTIKMADASGNSNEFYNDNNAISNNFKAANNIRAGVEIWPVSIFSLRLGYNYYDSSELSYDNSRHYASAGIGFRFNSFFMDIAYQQQCNTNHEIYQLYADYYSNDVLVSAPVLSEKYSNWKLLLTLGLRF